MKNQDNNSRKRNSMAILGVASTLLLAAACSSTGQAPAAKSGSQLWSENCARCHNFRSPSEFSDSQWRGIMFHMRVRAGLTAGETSSILEFLQASN